ncbi:hypothetical protein COV19_04410 [Candidatus Woesearchaeota archaeon CG10_big_fil_rev_8_21_14_0_10_44_13]|nr:MAG: hypothetical protein COV19_04410 [Candidatus Woesearchaeota archaeon CG10_big_fil_rev_8_21_14_0_10_44_13]
MKTILKNSVKKALGIALILLGIIGLFVPILQGILLILAGLLLLEYKPVTKFVHSLKEKWKKRRKS